jgi:hypothetical protein
VRVEQPSSYYGLPFAANPAAAKQYPQIPPFINGLGTGLAFLFQTQMTAVASSF